MIPEAPQFVDQAYLNAPIVGNPAGGPGERKFVDQKYLNAPLIGNPDGGVTSLFEGFPLQPTTLLQGGFPTGLALEGFPGLTVPMGFPVPTRMTTIQPRLQPAPTPKVRPTVVIPAFLEGELLRIVTPGSPQDVKDSEARAYGRMLGIEVKDASKDEVTKLQKRINEELDKLAKAKGIEVPSKAPETGEWGQDSSTALRLLQTWKAFGTGTSYDTTRFNDVIDQELTGATTGIANANDLAEAKKWLRSILRHESLFSRSLYRYEPNFYDRYLKDKEEWKKNEYYDEPERIASSYGPGHVMYTTAYQLGFRGKPEELLDFKTGTTYAAKAFASLLRGAGGDIEKAVKRYNVGPGGNTDSEAAKTYHEAVKTQYDKYEKK